MTPRIVRYAPVGTTKEGGGNMSKQQIPPLHCGMTNKKGKCKGKDQLQLQRQRQIPPLRCGMTNKEGKCKGKNNCYAHEVSISQLYGD
jgi:hypothetical protein